MENLDDVIREAELKVGKVLGYPIRLTIVINTNARFETYAKVWEVIFQIARKELASNSKLYPTSTLADYYKVYVLVCNKMPNIDTKTCMQIIGKDRTTYYHTLKSALDLLKTKDEKFMPRFELSIDKLKKNGHEGLDF